MAKVYAAPAYIGDPPEWDYKDIDAGLAAEDAWIKTVQAEAKKTNPKCDIAGEIIRFPIADGSAVYVIWNTTTLIHCPVGDGWQIPEAHARGLRAADLRAKVTQAKAFSALFGKSNQPKKAF